MDADEVSRRLETKHLIDSLRNCEWDIEKWMQSHYQKFKELFENLREVSFYYIPKGGLVAKPVLKTVIVDWSYVCTYQLWLKKMDCEDDLKQAQEKAVGKASLCGLGRFFDSRRKSISLRPWKVLRQAEDRLGRRDVLLPKKRAASDRVHAKN